VGEGWCETGNEVIARETQAHGLARDLVVVVNHAAGSRSRSIKRGRNGQQKTLRIAMGRRI